MEEKKNMGQEKPKKLTYEELAQVASDLQMSNQKLYERYQQLQKALAHSDFEFTSFVLSSLFKVVEHAEMYDDEFTKWCIDNIKEALTGIVNNKQQEEQEQGDAKAE